MLIVGIIGLVSVPFGVLGSMRGNCCLSLYLFMGVLLTLGAVGGGSTRMLGVALAGLLWLGVRRGRAGLCFGGACRDFGLALQSGSLQGSACSLHSHYPLPALVHPNTRTPPAVQPSWA